MVSRVTVDNSKLGYDSRITTTWLTVTRGVIFNKSLTPSETSLANCPAASTGARAQLLTTEATQRMSAHNTTPIAKIATATGYRPLRTGATVGSAGGLCDPAVGVSAPKQPLVSGLGSHAGLLTKSVADVKPATTSFDSPQLSQYPAR